MSSRPLALLLALMLALALLGPAPALASGGGGSKEKEGGGNQMILDTFLMNLTDRGGKSYLKLGVTVRFKTEKQKAEITSRLPIVREAILMALSTRSSKELETNLGKNKLKAEVRKLIAQRSGLPEDDLEIFFTDFVIQFVE